MADSGVEIRIEGVDAAEAMKALSEILAAELEATVTEQAQSRPAAGTRADPGVVLSVIAIILAFPGFVNSTIDLTTRLDLRNRLRTAFQGVIGRVGTLNAEIHFRVAKNNLVRLDEAHMDQLLDAAIEEIERRSAKK